MEKPRACKLGSVYGGATMDYPQELLNTARHHCQAIQTIIDQLTETKSNTELRLLSQTHDGNHWALHLNPIASLWPPAIRWAWAEVLARVLEARDDKSGILG